MAMESSPFNRARKGQPENPADRCFSNLPPMVEFCEIESERANLVLADDAIVGMRQALLGQFVPDQELDKALVL